MRMTIRLSDGSRVEAVLLAATRERMQVAIESQRDTVELRQIDLRWYTDTGAEIDIEALTAIPGG